jgi:hypothetical protein
MKKEDEKVDLNLKILKLIIINELFGFLEKLTALIFQNHN